MSKLLIVDDEIDIREFAKNFFQKRGIAVFTASGGQEALEIIEQETPDLVLLDVCMEDMTGVEVLRELRTKHNSVKVIMVTGVEEQAVLEETKALGVVQYIHKPLILEELEKVVMEELKT